MWLSVFIENYLCGPDVILLLTWGRPDRNPGMQMRVDWPNGWVFLWEGRFQDNTSSKYPTGLDLVNDVTTTQSFLLVGKQYGSP